MEKSSTNIPKLHHVKQVGIAYLTITFIGLLNTFLVKSGAYDVSSFSAAEHQFRLAQALDLVMYVVVIWLSWALYEVTKTVNKSTALLALLLRFGEGLLGCVAVMVVLTAPILLGGTSNFSAFNAAQLQELTSMFFSLSDLLWSILFVLMGIGAAIFIYLFHRANYIPSFLAYWGITVYILMIIYGFAKLMMPQFPEQAMLVMLPGALFELVFGLWITFKGISLEETTTAVS